MSDSFPEYDNLPIDEAVVVFDRVQRELDALGEQKTAMQKRFDFLRRVIIPKLMEEKDITSARFANIDRGVRIQDEFFVSCRNDQKEALLTWLADNGETHMIQETVAPSTLKAFVTRAMKEGKEYPADCVEVTIVPTARFY